MLSKGLKLLLHLVLLFPVSAFAHLLSISPVIAFPPKVIPGSTHIATYRMTNLSSHATVTVIDQSQFPYNSGFSIKLSRCNHALAPGASCTIQVQFIAPSTPQLVATELKEWAQPTTDCVQVPIEITVTNSLFNTFAYIARNHANNMALCPLNFSEDPLKNCSAIKALSSPANTAIFGHFFYAGFYAASPLIELCKINPDTGALNECTTTGSGFKRPFTVAINPAGDFAYIGDLANGAIFLCAIDPSKGTFSDCHAAATGFKKPTGLAFSPQGNLIYIADLETSTIAVCAVDPNSGDLSSCHPTGRGFTIPGGIVLNVTGTFAYVVEGNGSNSISICAVDPFNGNLNECTPTGSGFKSPSAMTFNIAGTKAYITNFNDSTVSSCTVNSNTGILYNCKTSDRLFSAPIGISLY